jgi:hypothetical protein
MSATIPAKQTLPAPTLITALAQTQNAAAKPAPTATQAMVGTTLEKPDGLMTPNARKKNKKNGNTGITAAEEQAVPLL